MYWYNKLYMGDSLKHKKAYYKYLIEHTRKITGTYCIMLSSSQDGLLDIYHSELLRLPHFDGKDQLIVGLAGTKRESRELAGRIILDVLKTTGGTDVRSCFDSHEASCGKKKR